MVEQPPSLGEKVRRLQVRYGEGVPAKMAEIKSAYSELMGAGSSADPGSTLDGLIAPVHRMSGSAASFGYTALGDAAAELEDCLVALKESSDALDDDHRARIAVLMETLQGAAANIAT